MDCWSWISTRRVGKSAIQIIHQGWLVECNTAVYNLGKTGPIRPRKTSRFAECTHHRQRTPQFALTASQPPGCSLRKRRIKFSSSCNTAKQINKCANGRPVEVAQSKPLCTTRTRWSWRILAENRDLSSHLLKVGLIFIHGVTASGQKAALERLPCASNGPEPFTWTTALDNCSVDCQCFRAHFSMQKGLLVWIWFVILGIRLWSRTLCTSHQSFTFRVHGFISWSGISFRYWPGQDGYHMPAIHWLLEVFQGRLKPQPAVHKARLHTFSIITQLNKTMCFR